MLPNRRRLWPLLSIVLIAGVQAVAFGTAIAIGAAAQQRADSLVPIGFSVVEATIDDVRAALAARQISCRQLTERYLERIRAYDHSGPALNAVQTLNPHALEDADRLDRLFATTGPVGPLHCVAVLIKDQIDTNDMPTSHGFAGFKGFVPQTDATVVTKLRNAGALIIGKATMGEFASGYISSASGPIRNAYDPRRNASGSSGGTGAGVAASFATIGIGEDTGGSVRGPASVHSLIGLRPTTPLVSRHGMSPARPSTDTIGPITRSVRDAALLLDVIAGYDPQDPVTAAAVGHVPATYTSALTQDRLNGLRIGVIRQPMHANTDPTSEDYRKVRAVVDGAIAELQSLGASIVDPVSIPSVIDRLEKVYDGNVYETEAAMNAYLASHPGVPFKSLRDILLSGLVVPSRARTLMVTVGRSVDEIGYLQLLKLQDETRQIVLALMADQKLNALMYATFDHQPGIIADDVMTRTVVVDTVGLGHNRRLSPILGFPAITVPAGFTSDGMPVGIEFMGRAFDEPLLFRLAFSYERGTHHRKPPSLRP
jgi:amidase